MAKHQYCIAVNPKNVSLDLQNVFPECCTKINLTQSIEKTKMHLFATQNIAVFNYNYDDHIVYLDHSHDHYKGYDLVPKSLR